LRRTREDAKVLSAQYKELLALLTEEEAEARFEELRERKRELDDTIVGDIFEEFELLKRRLRRTQ
jgi:hypothetical protein